MARATELNLINKIADLEREIVGVKNSYDAYANPDNLTNAMLPAVLHVPSEFTSEPAAHHGAFRNTIRITSILFVKSREQMGGKLSFLDNETQPFLYKWRVKFQANTSVRALLTAGGAVQKATLVRGRYGSGGNLLTHNGIPYIGCIFEYEFIETN
jgi:hypothetical protein